MRKNILIYPANSYSAMQVLDCLRYSLRYKPVMGNHGRTHCEYVYDDCFFDLPLITDEDFIEEMNRFLVENRIAYIIPTHDTVAEFLQSIAEELKAVVVCSAYETAKICRHKSLTYGMLKEFDFIPRVYREDEEINYPVFVKDDVGQGGKNSFLANNEDELKSIFRHSPNIQYVICENLPGMEITVDCFTNRKKELLYCQPRPREEIMNGISGFTYNMDLTDEIRRIADCISVKLCFHGYWFFQCKQDISGKYKLMEISTRFAGTFCLSKNLDVNLPLLSLTDFDGIDVKIVPNSYRIATDRFYVNRYKIDYDYKRVYIDFDDTIAINREKYIVKVMAFLYQCFNENVEMILLTRHAYNIYETMDRLFLDQRMFRDIIEVREGKCKADYMSNEIKSIFIDNSFAERVDVKEKLGIPGFDVCNVECLMKG